MEIRPLSPEPAEDEGELLPSTFIKSEVNFARLPFFTLSRKDSSSRIEIEYRDTAERDGEKLEIAWIVTANAKFGFPTPFDKKVHKAIEFLISRRDDFPVENPVVFSLYEICKIMNIDAHSGKNHEMIRKALIRTALAGVQSKGTFYSKGEKRWIEDVFHLYDRVIFAGETLPDGNTADKNHLFLGDWYLKSLNSFYVKPFDHDYYLSLRSNVAGRLYEFLSLQFYGSGGEPYRISYPKLCEVLPVTEYKYPSRAKEKLAPAHKELISKKFLSAVKWQKQDRLVVIYYPGKKAKAELSRFGGQMELDFTTSKEKETKGDEGDLPFNKSTIAEQLVQRGITGATARKLVENYPIDRIQGQLKIFDWLKERKSSLVKKNPAGFLRRSIEEDYQPPKEYLDHRDREVRERKEEDRRKRWLQHREKLIKQDLADWDKTPPEERAKGRLDFWIVGERINGRQPTPEQIEVKKQELIDNLPKTNEEKREYIARNYPEGPPDDFE